MSNRVLLVFGILALYGLCSGQVKREREESITDLTASNTMGFGNLWIRTGLNMESRYRTKGALEPRQDIGIGLSQNFSAWAGAVVFEHGLKSVVGKMDAHMKATLPWNDNLRLFGVGLQGDLILSTEQDTLGVGKDTARPAFTPQLGLTVAVDADLIKRFNRLPLKIYLNWSTIDNERVLALYRQQSYRAGVEWKGERHSLFAGLRYGRYRRVTGVDSLDAQSTFDQSVLTLLPGVRLRPFDRLSVIGTLVLAVAGNLKKGSEPDYGRYGFRVALELPLFFRETNAEAIRSMIFLEQKKTTGEEKAEGKPVRNRGADDVGSLFLIDDGRSGQELGNTLKEEDFVEEKERQLKEKRKKINEELQTIEQLLE